MTDSLDYLNQFEAFHWLDKDAKQRVRARAAEDMVATDSGNAAVSRDLNEGLSNILAGKPPPGINSVSVDLENVDRKVEYILSQYFESTAGRKFRGVNFLYGADDTIRSVPRKIIEDFSSGIDAGPDDIIAISATRPGDYWRITSFESLQMVMEQMSLDIHCDLDLMKNTDVGPCIDQYAWLHKLKEQDKAFTLPEHKDHYQREYIPQHFATIPFAYGNVIVLARICMTCYSAWLYRNQIQTDRISDIEPIGDGFGSVGGGPITKSEYLWDQTVVERVYRDWELRNGKPPTLIELQKALQGTKFVGAESEETQKMTDKRSKHKKP